MSKLSKIIVHFKLKMKIMIVFGIILHVSLQASAVEMLEGQSILLFCEFPTDELVRPTVEWSRSVLSPSTVHQRQQEGDQLIDQNQLYRGRTSMKAEALETGDLSLNLTNLQTSDTGTYSCSVRKGKLLRAKTFYLKVKAQQVEVNSGTESVLLPCRTIDHLPVDVEWRDGYDDVVHVYENGSDQPGEQNQIYRTRMDEDLLKTGDLSLTLRDPTLAGTYTCRVYSRDGEILMEEKVLFSLEQFFFALNSNVYIFCKLCLNDLSCCLC
uniref:Ig-like domain-containing protein n=1 Tax=Poecilia reticulata TaxID=8081 RepID=A0A3P9PI80_POERE